MVQISSFAFSQLVLFVGLVTSLPTSRGNGSAHVTKRDECPPVIRLPIHWDDDLPEDSDDKATGGCFSPMCLPWSKTRKNKKPEQKESSGIKISLNYFKSTAALCAYTMAEWDTKPAYVVIPATEEGALRRKYDAQVELWGKLGKVLAETQIDNLPAVVVEDSHGKNIYETLTWVKFFEDSTRDVPSDAAHERCESLVTRAHEAVRDKLRWYAEQKGLLYSLEAFNFKSSVVWSDDWEDVEFINWEPTLTHNWPEGQKTRSMQNKWLRVIANKDLRTSEGWYKNPVTTEITYAQGWCDGFKVEEETDEEFVESM